MVGERLRRVRGAGHEPAGEVPEIAPDEVLLYEALAPPRERDRVPTEPEHDERGDAGGREEPRKAAEFALPEEEAAERQAEQHRRDGALGERRGAHERERRRRVAATAVPPPAKREAERGREERDQQHVRSGHTGVVEERGRRRDERRGDEPAVRSEELHAEEPRPGDERG